MREKGKVREYNGHHGKIIGQDGKEYLLLEEQIMPDEEINHLDDVSFVPENYRNSEVNEDIARFVKKYIKTK